MTLVVPPFRIRNKTEVPPIQLEASEWERVARAILTVVVTGGKNFESNRLFDFGTGDATGKKFLDKQVLLEVERFKNFQQVKKKTNIDYVLQIAQSVGVAGQLNPTNNFTQDLQKFVQFHGHQLHVQTVVRNSISYPHYLVT